MRGLAQGLLALTICGWTPGLRLVSGRTLECGCLTGTYHTRDGDTVTILDERAPECRDGHHRRDRVLWRRAKPLEWPFGHTATPRG